MYKKVKVAVGLLVDSRGHVFMAKRNTHGHRPDLWEYPGGKVESDESWENALIREWQEELGLRITVGGLISEAELRIECDATLRLYEVKVTDHINASIKLNVHSDGGWFDPRHAILRVPMSPATYLFYRDIMESDLYRLRIEVVH